MRKRTSAPVTLARGGAGRAKPRTARDDATPERLRQARRGGTAEVDGAGVRRIGEPFDALRARNLLDRADRQGNEALWQAGDRLRGHWHLGKLNGLSALDVSRPAVDGGLGAGGLSPTEAALRHRDHFRRATEAVGPRLMPYVAGIVIEERAAGDLRALVTDTAHARTAEALVLERLREGLHRLCDLWRMGPKGRSAPIEGWRGDA